jgi:hypothetical protein
MASTDVAPRHDDRRHRVRAGGCREQEEDRQADGGEQPPHHAHRVHPGRTGQIQHHRQPGERGDRANHGEPPRPLTVPQPQPADNQHRAEVLQQQRNPHRHPLDGVEVAQLDPCHRDHTEGGDLSRPPAQQLPPSAQVHQGGDGEQERRYHDPGQHGGGWAPARADQRRRECPRGAEGRGRKHGKRKASPIRAGPSGPDPGDRHSTSL